MQDFDHAGFLKSWFPSIAATNHPARFFWAHNEFLCTTPAAKRAVLDDKLLFSGLLAVSGLPAPRTLVTILGGRLVSGAGEELSEAEAVRRLEGRGAFAKTRTGWGGEGSFRIDADGTIHGTDGTRVTRSLGGWLRRIRKTDYLVQELVEQDERCAQAAPASVNTVRCITFPGSGDEEPRVALAFWRVGNGRTVVDNISSGGMICAVDPSSGRVISRAADKTRMTYEAHPVTGFRFNGTELPGFGAILRTVRAGHRALDTSMSIAWDVAVTPGGPMILEGNGHWGISLEDLIQPGYERVLWNAFMAGRRVAGSGFPAETGPVGEADMVRATLSIRGRVQGVGYRRWVARHAAERGVQAEARNLGDGSVRCRLWGQRWRVEFVTLACHRGPSVASVEGIDVREVRRLR